MLSVSYFGWIAKRRPERFGDLAVAMGRDVDGLPQEQRAGEFVMGLRKLISDSGLDDEKLSGYGVKKDDLRKFAENSFDVMGKLYAITPVEMSVDDVVSIYESAYA